MLLPLIGLAASLAASSGDTVLMITRSGTPTVTRTPVIGVRSHIIADSIVVEKAKRTLTLYQTGIPVRVYRVSLGGQPVGDKVRRGDGRTPEGLYRVDFKNAQSKYHLGLHISYPDAAHTQRANALGLSPGGDIMIHGLPPKFADVGQAAAEQDWTEGCIAVSDEEIEEIFRAVPQGAPIQIKP
jgi:murein L,D-transpeptidase YafK